MKFHLSSAGALFYIIEPSLFCVGGHEWWGENKFLGRKEVPPLLLFTRANENEKKYIDGLDLFFDGIFFH